MDVANGLGASGDAGALGVCAPEAAPKASSSTAQRQRAGECATPRRRSAAGDGVRPIRRRRECGPRGARRHTSAAPATALSSDLCAQQQRATRAALEALRELEPAASRASARTRRRSRRVYTSGVRITQPERGGGRMRRSKHAAAFTAGHCEPGGVRSFERASAAQPNNTASERAALLKSRAAPPALLRESRVDACAPWAVAVTPLQRF